MSSKDDDFIGSPDDFVRVIDSQWYEWKLNELQKLESELDYNLIETLPIDLRERLMGMTQPQQSGSDSSLISSILPQTETYDKSDSWFS